ncbi:putative transcriptional regulator [Candidatus Regiella insecticola 5.15]|uniref:Putative transcriptional regulator n=1 Tax=Candidatus Regiella insecticola 5.15 TaxID=1005043 RepID=G2GXF3_9ENTR|nr:helix-turn-helix domain-containing protein [Candidatus Regiella insecticola]EGY29575.1 putative transcriptional regulator [Candidatus Regiella insecticola 5.15]
MNERNIFDELMQGMEAWGNMNAGKETLKIHRLSSNKGITLFPSELKALREKLNLSQAVFAQYLHTGVTTYQNWEQGRAKPNQQAVLLIKMVEKNPATLSALAAL